MILSDQSKIETFTANGKWGSLTLDELLKQTASDFPDKVAVRDASNRRHWTSGGPRELSYRALDNEANQICRFLIALGIEAGTIAAAQLPPTTDAVSFLYGAWRAGVIILPISMTENLAGIKEIVENSGARILVTCGHFEGAQTGIRMRDVAAECFNVRYPIGLGPNLPEGLISLQDALVEFDETAITKSELNFPDDRANHIATLTSDIDTKTGEKLFYPRNHNQWLCSAWAHIMDSGLNNGAVVGSFMGLCNLAGLSTGLLTALLTNGTLQFEFAQTVHGMTRAIKNGTHQAVILPGSLIPHIPTNAFDHLQMINAIWPKTHISADLTDNIECDRQINDVTVFGEIGMIITRRKKGEKPSGLPLELNANSVSSSNAPQFLTIEIKGLKDAALDEKTTVLGGELMLSGPMTCDAPFAFYPPTDYQPADILATDIACRVINETPPSFVPIGFLNDSPLIGSCTVKPGEIVRFVRAFEDIEDAKLIAIDEQLLGKRLVLQIEPRDRFSFKPDKFDEVLSRLLRTDADLISLVDTPVANISTFHEDSTVDRKARQASLRNSIEARLKEMRAAVG